MIQKTIEEFLEFSTQFAHRYLACGGPTSRLEEKLGEFGDDQDVRTEVFATSTGVFITIHNKEQGNTFTRMSRIKSGANDFSELVRLERILTSISNKEIGFRAAIDHFDDNTGTRSNFVFFLALLVFGACASLPQYGSVPAAMGSGLIVSMVFWLSGSFAKSIGLSGVFGEFIGCLFAFVASAFLSVQTGVHPRAFAIGALILMVPGLTLTNAISELAEHNFVSGTSKMMRSILTLSAMGTAFLLVQDIASMWGEISLLDELVVNNFKSNLGLQVVGISGLISTTAILFNVPLRYIPFALITGLASWAILRLLSGHNYYVLASFLPAFSVGVFSLLFGRIFKIPSQVFSVPGILSLVPGMLALSTFYEFTAVSSGVNTYQAGTSMRVLVVASSIVFGLFTARMPFMIFSSKKDFYR